MTELGDHSAEVRQVGQRFKLTQDVGDDPGALLGSPLFSVPGRQLLQVRERQVGEYDRDSALVHGVCSLLQEVRLDFLERVFRTLFGAGQSFHHGA